MGVVAVIDTNLLVRGVLSAKGGSRALIVALKRGEFVPVTCRPHLAELYGVLGYTRLTRKWPIARRIRNRIVAQLYQRAIWVEPEGTLHLCRDPRDDYLVEAALLAKAAYLVTEDSDLHDDPALLKLLSQRGVQAVRLAEFLAVLRNAQGA